MKRKLGSQNHNSLFTLLPTEMLDAINSRLQLKELGILSCVSTLFYQSTKVHLLAAKLISICYPDQYKKICLEQTLNNFKFNDWEQEFSLLYHKTCPDITKEKYCRIYKIYSMLANGKIDQEAFKLTVEDFNMEPFSVPLLLTQKNNQALLDYVFDIVKPYYHLADPNTHNIYTYSINDDENVAGGLCFRDTLVEKHYPNSFFDWLVICNQDIKKYDAYIRIFGKALINNNKEEFFEYILLAYVQLLCAVIQYGGTLDQLIYLFAIIKDYFNMDSMVKPDFVDDFKRMCIDHLYRANVNLDVAKYFFEHFETFFEDYDVSDARKTITLIDVRIDVFASDYFLIAAAKQGDVDALKFFLKDRAINSRLDLMLPESEEELSIPCFSLLLLIAKLKNHRVMAEYLISKGANLHDKDDDDCNRLLILATEFNSFGLLKFLFEEASVKITNKDEARYVVDFVTRLRLEELDKIEYIIRTQKSTIENLIDIHWMGLFAASQNRWDIVKLLMKYGVNVKPTDLIMFNEDGDHRQYTLLDLAKKHQNQEMIELWGNHHIDGAGNDALHASLSIGKGM